MKKIFLIAFLMSQYLGVYSQQKNKVAGGQNTNTVQNPVKKKLGQNNQAQLMVQSLKHDTCLDKKFSIAFYFIQDSTFALSTPTIMANNDTIIAKALRILNKAFKPICVSFVSCKRTVIPYYPYNDWKKVTIDTVVTTSWYTDKTINVYLPEVLVQPPVDPGDFVSYAHPVPASFTATPKDVIVVQRINATDSNYAVFHGSHLLHAFGHYFGLPDTFGEINPTLPVSPGPPANVISKEFVNRSNCYTHGDGFCDTEADPGPAGLLPAQKPYCYSQAGMRDGNSDQYVVPVYNIMASSASECRCIFTQEQYNYMAYIILTRRMYLH